MYVSQQSHNATDSDDTYATQFQLWMIQKPAYEASLLYC